MQLQQRRAGGSSLSPTVAACPTLLTRIDGATNIQEALIDIDGPEGVNIAFNPTTKRLYVASTVITVVDAASFTRVTAIESPPAKGNFNHSIVAVNVATNAVYTANEEGLVVIKGADNTILGTVPLSLAERGGRGITVNPYTGKIYLSSPGQSKIMVFK